MTKTFLAGMLTLFAASAATAATINFEDLTGGTTVTNQYAGLGVTFSSAGGQSILVTTQAGYNSTPPNFICTGLSGGINCTGEVILNFSAPVDNLQFDAVGNQNAIGSSFATIDVFQLSVLTSTFNLFVSQGGLNPDHQNLSAFSGITRIRIYNNTDPAGTGYDTFSFTAGGASTPEPSTFALLGFTGLFCAGLRRRAR